MPAFEKHKAECYVEVMTHLTYVKRWTTVQSWKQVLIVFGGNFSSQAGISVVIFFSVAITELMCLRDFVKVIFQ